MLAQTIVNSRRNSNESMIVPRTKRHCWPAVSQHWEVEIKTLPKKMMMAKILVQMKEGIKMATLATDRYYRGTNNQSITRTWDIVTLKVHNVEFRSRTQVLVKGRAIWMCRTWL